MGVGMSSPSARRSTLPRVRRISSTRSAPTILYCVACTVYPSRRLVHDPKHRVMPCPHRVRWPLVGERRTGRKVKKGGHKEDTVALLLSPPHLSRQHPRKGLWRRRERRIRRRSGRERERSNTTTYSFSCRARQGQELRKHRQRSDAAQHSGVTATVYDEGASEHHGTVYRCQTVCEYMHTYVECPHRNREAPTYL